MLYFSRTNVFSWFTLSRFGMARPHCFHFATLSYLIPLQQFDCHARVTFFCINSAFFLQSNDLIPPLNVAFCWYIGRTTCCQTLTLVTFWMNYWRQFTSTVYFLQLWLKRNSMPLVTNYWCHMYVTLFSSFFQLVSKCHGWWLKCIFNGVKQGLKHLIWIFLFLSMLKYLVACFCAPRVVLLWEYKLFTLIWELYTPISFETTSSLKYSWPRWIPLIPENKYHT